MSACLRSSWRQRGTAITVDLLNMTKDTPLEVKTDGEALIVRPVTKAPLMDRALAAADRLMDAHEETYRKLAR